MKTLTEQLKDLQDTSGTNAKLDWLRTCSPEFKEFLVLALDPYQMYGVRDFPEPTIGCFNPSELGPIESLAMLKELLGKLHRRELTGNAAKAACTAAEGCGLDRDILLACLTKDIRAGVAATSINKVFPGLIPEFLVALCEVYDPVTASFPGYVSDKKDGLRCLAFCQPDGVVEFKTRNGLPIPAADPLKIEMMDFFLDNFRHIGPCVFDGEITAGTHFQESVSALRKKNQKAENSTFVIFDWLKEDSFLQKTGFIVQKARYAFLLDRIPKGDKIQISKEELCYNHEEVMARYKDARARGEEGIIFKEADKPYFFGRSSYWTKVKAVETRDCRVVGLEEGKGKYKGTLGKLVVQWAPGVTTTISGMTDKQRFFWWGAPNEILDKMVEVLYQEETKDGLPRHGRFAQVRWDKS